VDDHCVFCDIIAGRVEASVVYRNNHCLAIMDICPINTGHLLVIPLAHASDLAGLRPSVGGELFEAAKRVAGAIRQSSLKPDGVNLLLADGEAAGQEVFHVHLHVLPRFRGDGFGHKFPPHYGCRPSREELDGAAAVIRASLEVA
jgi:diadenosine tetraphosphate (Ap4A) HIT family hydrolase